MKEKLSVSMDKETICLIDEKIKEGLFRNKSHIIEYAVNKLLRG